MNAVDTNVLFYARDAREPAKRKIAASLIETLDDGVLLWQVACEYLWASRKLEPLGYSVARAYRDIRRLRCVWQTVIPDWGCIDRAEDLQERYALSYWDALIISACIEAGVEKLYSEDFDAGRRIDSLEIVNPFAAA
jgi:predicted nucleic acid-binding protein